MRTEHAEVDVALARLDPARSAGSAGEPEPLSAAQSRRAALTLDRILASDPDGPGRRADLVTVPPRRRRLRVLVPLLAVAGAVAVVVPVLTTGGDRAYASWSPLPVALSPADAATAARACLADVDPGTTSAVTPLLAERRGGWTYVLVRPAEDRQSSCLMPSEEIAAPPPPDRRRWFSSDDDEVLEPVRRADEVRVETSATGTTREGLFRYSEGAVGRDVVDVTFTTVRGVTVHASVANGRYAAWWPAGENRLRNPEISGAPDVDVTLADGTTYRLPR